MGDLLRPHLHALSLTTAGILIAWHPTAPYYFMAISLFSAVIIASWIPEEEYQQPVRRKTLTQITTAITHIYRHISLRRFVIIFATLTVLANWNWLVFQPLLLQFQVPEPHIGFFYMGGACLSVLGSMTAKQLANLPNSRNTLLLIYTTVAVLGLSIYGITSSQWLIATLLLLHLPFGTVHPLVVTALNRNIASEERATIVSIVSSFKTLLLGGTGYCVGVIADTYSPQAVPPLAGLLIGLLVATAFFAIPRSFFSAQSDHPEPA